MSEVVDIPRKTLIGIEEVGPSSFNADQGSGASFSEKLWRRFIAMVIAAELPLDVDMYGVSWPADDKTPPDFVHYFCGLESDVLPEGFRQLAVEGGPYFQFRYEGPATEIDLGFQDAYMKALPESGLKPREGQHLEIYGDEYDPEAPIVQFRILIPVMP